MSLIGEAINVSDCCPTCNPLIPCAGAHVPRTLFLSVSSSEACEAALLGSPLPAVFELTFDGSEWTSGDGRASFAVNGDCLWGVSVDFDGIACSSPLQAALSYSPFDWSENLTLISECLSEVPSDCGSSFITFEVS